MFHSFVYSFFNGERMMLSRRTKIYEEFEIPQIMIEILKKIVFI